MRPQRRALAVVVALLAALARPAAGGDDPLAGLALEDGAGRTWDLDDLAGVPVLLVVAERRAAAEGDAWGARLAAEDLPLAPWRAPGRVAWVSVADLGRVPPWARDAARDRLGDRPGMGGGAPAQRSPLLHDWKGTVARRLGASRGEATVVLLSADRRRLAQEAGPPDDAAVARVAAAVRRAAPDA